ncbi:Protein xylosyltransferase, partial [Durusdinium trenchii]
GGLRRPTAALPPVVAIRLGCSWAEELWDYEGEVSIVPDSCEISLVCYLSSVGFEGELAIHWFREHHLLRQSGGRIPKGFSMFVDRFSRRASPGRWWVTLTDTQTGHRIGERSFIVYSAEAAPRLEDYQEFFDFTPELEKRAS